MSDHQPFDPQPTKRFSGLAEVYAKARPGYPAEAISEILQRAALDGNSLLVDIGAGTGISARLFAEQGIPVTGVEPNEDMRKKAESQKVSSGKPEPHYLAASAEHTSLPDECASAVLCAQSFHWFEPSAALAEFKRILKNRGWVALMWNERDESDPFTAAYGKVIRSLKETPSVESPRGKAGLALIDSELFCNQQKRVFKHSQKLDENGLVERSFSASYSPREPKEAAIFAAKVREVYREFCGADSVVLRYETSVYLGKKE